VTRPQPEPTRITVCLPTRNRGASITPTLESLTRLDHDSFDVVVVDQSTDDRSWQAFCETAGDDKRFTCVRSKSVGKSAACNIAVDHAQGTIIAFTDDDCTAPFDWLSRTERAFADNPGVAMICGGVRAAAHDPTHGAIPAFTPPRTRLHHSRWLRYQARGMGANFAFQAGPLREEGPFDEVLGSGGPLRAGDDRDKLYRMLGAGFGVLDLPEPAVTHYGLRTWGAELRGLSWNAAMSEGVICMKFLRMGDPTILPTLLVHLLGRTVNWRNVIRLQRPTGFGRSLAFVRGMLASFRYPIDRASRIYIPRRRTSAVSRGRWPKAPSP